MIGNYRKTSNYLSTLFLIVAMALLLFKPTTGWAYWSFSGGTGADYNIPSYLKIVQNGQTILIKKADYETYPFDKPVFYDLRLAHWVGNGAWELEFLHHKIYLQNPPAAVQNFSISHGYNLFYLNRAFMLKHAFRLRIGGGLVIAHPENTVNNLQLNDSTGGPFGGGYYLSGVTGQVGISRRFYFSKQMFGLMEGKFLASYARVNVVNGYAIVPNFSAYAF